MGSTLKEREHFSCIQPPRNDSILYCDGGGEPAESVVEEGVGHEICLHTHLLLRRQPQLAGAVRQSTIVLHGTA